MKKSASEMKDAFDFEIVATKAGVRLGPRGLSTDRSVQQLSFAGGSSLFVAVAQVLQGRNGYFDPDQIEWPPLPDPLGILLGKQELPWKLLNPAVKRCIRCEPAGDGGMECHYVACENEPRV